MFNRYANLKSYSLIAFSTIVALFRFSARYFLDVDCSIVLFASKLCDGTAFGANIRWRRKSHCSSEYLNLWNLCLRLQSSSVKWIEQILALFTSIFFLPVALTHKSEMGLFFGKQKTWLSTFHFFLWLQQLWTAQIGILV